MPEVGGRFVRVGGFSPNYFTLKSCSLTVLVIAVTFYQTVSFVQT